MSKQGNLHDSRLQTELTDPFGRIFIRLTVL